MAIAILTHQINSMGDAIPVDMSEWEENAIEVNEMSPKLMIEPSCWLGEGITLETAKGYKLFKFTEELQTRSDELLERNKLGNLTAEEKAELNGINELAQIFTYANSLLAAETQKTQWSQNPTENLSENGQKNGVNIAIPQNS